jgi:DNA-binding SARP family transcriptional activator
VSGQRHWLSIVEKAENFQTGIASLEDKPEAATTSEQTRIELFAFGSGQVWLNGEPIAASQWASARSRALFSYLCMQKRATRDQIALEFWPDFSQAQVSSNFHATLWRVRHAVGSDIIAREGDTYSISTAISYWCDAAEFDSLIQHANSKAISEEERADYLRQAVELYKGPYLESIDMAWASDRRHAYQQANFAALLGLGKWELGRRRYEAAKEWYEKAAQEDNLDGEAAFGLLSSLVQSGAIAEARAVYMSYKKRLADELDEEPPPHFKQLHESFR